jgi:FkbM family methyltransferase
MIKHKFLKLFTPIFYIIGLIIKKFHLPVKQEGFKIQFPALMTNTELGCSIISKYEKNEIKLVKKYLKSSDSVIEMGACIGVVSLTINKLLSDKTKQVSIEPNPQMHKYLYENKKINNGYFQVETCIVSKSKEVSFFLGGQAFLGSNILGGGEKIIIPGKTLEELTKQYFDFTVIVMDIEGAELEFFRSFDLKNTRIRLIIWETHVHPKILTSDDLIECYKKLQVQGFNFIEKSGDVEAWSRSL